MQGDLVMTSKRKYKYKRVYFGEDSVFKAVKDIGKPGVNTRKEFVKLCLSQLADLADLKTKDKKTGRTIKWTKQLWARRTFILRQLNKIKRFRLGRLVDYIDRVGRAFLDKKIGPAQLAEALDKIAKKYCVSVKEAREIAKKVTQQKKVLVILIKHIDGHIEKVVFGKTRRISRKKLKAAKKLGARVAKKLRKKFDEETKRIADYLWSMIPERYKRKPLRIWYYVMVLWLAYYIRKYSREKGLDWRAIDWASEIDWKEGYRHAKHFIAELLRSGLSKYEDWTKKDFEEYDKYIEQMMQWEKERLAEAIA